MTERIYLYDTTLRDGAQTQGVDFGVADKRAIAEALDQLGLDYVEGGWPGANPTDDAFFADAPAFKQTRFAAFGMTRRAGRSASNDPGLTSVLAAGTPVVTLFGKTWDFHARHALGVELDEAVAMIGDSIAEIVRRGREAIFDAEHFFDGYKENPGFARDCLVVARDAGARWIVLCDTNGGTLPHEVERIVGDLTALVPGDRLGIHCHNDTDNAVANSLAAVRAGARQVQGTLNGLGERCGNANLTSIIPNLMLKLDYATGISAAQLARLTHVSRLLDDRLNRAPSRGAAYVGESAFAHKGGVHVSAVERDPRTYEHILPDAVGNRRNIVVSDQSGRANILARFRELGLTMASDDPRLLRLIEDVKQREHDGFAYDGAEASFELLARRALGGMLEYFSLVSFRVITERRFDARGELITLSEATVKLDAGGQRFLTVGEGVGPVNALDGALRAALVPMYPDLVAMRLIDYKVRILTPEDGTKAVTRVMIESADGPTHGPGGRHWSTIGVSANVIDASYNALHDAITWKLFHDSIAGRAGAA